MSNVCAPPKFICWHWAPMMMISGVEAFGRWKSHKGRALSKWDQGLHYENGSRQIPSPLCIVRIRREVCAPNGSSPECASSLQKGSKCLLFISHPASGVWYSSPFISHPAGGVWYSSLSTLRQTMCSYWLLNCTLKFCDIKMPIYCWRQFIWKNDEICIFTKHPR